MAWSSMYSRLEFTDLFRLQGEERHHGVVIHVVTLCSHLLFPTAPFAHTPMVPPPC